MKYNFFLISFTIIIITFILFSSYMQCYAIAENTNTPPQINFASITTDKSMKWIFINYIAIDTNKDTCSLFLYEYSISVDNQWYKMTEKENLGSNGTNDLLFTNDGNNLMFIWDIINDLSNIIYDTVYIRLQASDGNDNGNIALAAITTLDLSSLIIPQKNDFFNMMESIYIDSHSGFMIDKNNTIVDTTLYNKSPASMDTQQTVIKTKSKKRESKKPSHLEFYILLLFMIAAIAL